MRNQARPVRLSWWAASALLVLISNLFAARDAAAQGTSSPSEIAAEAEFAAGVTLMKGGQCEAALLRFRESQRQSPASGTLLDIAYCEQQLGHRARAFIAYQQALPIAQSTGKTEHVRLAHEGTERLSPELGWLWLRLAAPSERWQIQIDGSRIESATDSLIPLDPGEHTIIASVGEHSNPARSVSVTAGQRLTLDVEEPAARPAVVAPKQNDSQPTAPVAPNPSPQQQSPARGRTSSPKQADADATLAALGWGLTGVGATAVATGIGLFIHARLRYDSADCPNNQCVGAPKDERDAAAKEWVWSYLSAGAGAVVLGTGLTLLWLESPNQDAKVSARITPWSVAVEGVF
ncbi:MAG TPA: hypothetical protein VHM70_10020 [Polyangiaceae bacterium]|nr:hypothetical protein [Polyangiaceae bacterium]